METTNRSRIKCDQHPNQQITNFCSNFNCLRPLCPDCVEIHTKSHSKQQIQSWKNCINKASKNIRNTLTKLKQILNKGSFQGQTRSIQAIQSDAIKKLNRLKNDVMQMVEEIFTFYEKQIRNNIKKQFSINPIDHSKLKLAIQQLQKLGLKLSTTNTVMHALKKCILLDHQSLVGHFQQEYKYLPNKAKRQQFTFSYDQQCLAKTRKYLEKLVSYQNQAQAPPPPQLSNRSIGSPRLLPQDLYKGPKFPISITNKNYFGETSNKFLHFFVPFSNQLKILHLSHVNQPAKWKTIKLNIKNVIPTFHKSLITPNGEIYITGGSQDGVKLNTIYRYNQQKNTLQFVANMINPRSSHSISYCNNNIYLLGGFKMDNQVYRQCQVLNLQTKKCKAIASLCYASANGSSNSFNNSYIFKFGGVFNKVSSSNHIQMYSIMENQWAVIDPQLEKFSQNFWLLSFSACVQINQNQIFIFGGYNDAQHQESSNLTYTLYVQNNQNQKHYVLKNINSYPLPEAEGFWDNNPIIFDGKVYALQNITDTDQISSLVDQRRIVIFNGKKWATANN